MTQKTLSIGEVRAWLEGHGKSYAEVASELGVTRFELNAVLAGRTQCLRGKPHRIAVGLRLKPLPTEAGDYAVVLPLAATVRRWLRDNEIAPKKCRPLTHRGAAQ